MLMYYSSTSYKYRMNRLAKYDNCTESDHDVDAFECNRLQYRKGTPVLRTLLECWRSHRINNEVHTHTFIYTYIYFVHEEMTGTVPQHLPHLAYFKLHFIVQ